jgi:hypothetical protein
MSSFGLGASSIFMLRLSESTEAPMSVPPSSEQELRVNAPTKKASAKLRIASFFEFMDPRLRDPKERKFLFIKNMVLGVKAAEYKFNFLLLPIMNKNC